MEHHAKSRQHDNRDEGQPQILGRDAPEQEQPRAKPDQTSEDHPVGAEAVAHPSGDHIAEHAIKPIDQQHHRDQVFREIELVEHEGRDQGIGAENRRHLQKGRQDRKGGADAGQGFEHMGEGDRRADLPILHEIEDGSHRAQGHQRHQQEHQTPAHQCAEIGGNRRAKHGSEGQPGKDDTHGAALLLRRDHAGANGRAHRADRRRA